RDILFALLVPSEAQLHALKGQESWSVEARELYTTTLGLTLKTRAKAWSALAEEVWRFLLFSEFAFDLPVPLPEALTDVTRALQALAHQDTDAMRAMLPRHAQSVWNGTGESQAQWGLLQAALQLIDACDDYGRLLSDHARDQETLIDFYLGSLREADRLQREFEQAVGDAVEAHDIMAGVIEQARTRYRRLAASVQVLFTKNLEVSGWPPSGRLANA